MLCQCRLTPAVVAAPDKTEARNWLRPHSRSELRGRASRESRSGEGTPLQITRRLRSHGQLPRSPCHSRSARHARTRRWQRPWHREARQIHSVRSRLRRNPDDCLEAVLASDHAAPRLDTTTPVGNRVANVVAAVAEEGRDILALRTREGLAAAKTKGLRLGAPSRQEPATVARLQSVRDDDMTDRELADVPDECETPLHGWGTRWHPASVRLAGRAYLR